MYYKIYYELNLKKSRRYDKGFNVEFMSNMRIVRGQIQQNYMYYRKIYLV